MKSRIKLPLYQLSPLGLLALARNVVAKMTGNAAFASPKVALVDMTAKADALEAAIELATDGSRQSRLERNDLIAELGNMLSSQADYVRSICLGDRTMLASSGFELAKTPEPIGLPKMPLVKMAKMTGKSGQIELRWTSEHGASVYQVWMTDQDPAEKSNWVVTGITTKVNHVVNHLESYKAYWFAISAIGAAGEGLKSDPVLVRAA